MSIGVAAAACGSSRGAADETGTPDGGAGGLDAADAPIDTHAADAGVDAPDAALEASRDAAAQDAEPACEDFGGGDCPADRCDVACCPDGPECAACCVAKPCQGFDAESCPAVGCQLLPGCDGVRRRLGESL